MHAPSQAASSPELRAAIAALQQGEFILVYDGDEREGETDLFIPARSATPAAIRKLRSEAGGLVFVALGPEVHDALGLPFLHDLYADAGERYPLLADLVPEKLPYDARSSFSLTVNHRDTFTGITDEDRALTVSSLGKLASLEPCLPEEELRDRFVERFRTPGHVHICSAAPGLLSERRGHTELAVTLARMSGLPEALVGAEILDGDGAMSPADARGLAEDWGLTFLHGRDIVAAWESFEETPTPIGART